MNRLPLGQVEKELRKERAGLEDRYVTLEDFRLDVLDPTAEAEQRFRLFLSDGGTRGYAFTPTSLRQVCSLAGVPRPFLERVPPTLGLGLLRTMLETSALGDGRPHLLRLRQEVDPPIVRAVLPPSFVRLDDAEVLEEVRKVARDREVKVNRVHVGEDIFFLRLILPERMDLGGRGRPDPGWPGLDLVTSETGRYSLELRHVMVRQVCSNGMTSVSEEGKALKTRKTGVDRPALTEALRGALAGALGMGRAMADRLADTRGQFVADATEEVAKIFQRYRLGSVRGRLAQWILGEAQRERNLFGVERFDIVQAFTAVARDLEPRDRMRIEDAMGAYVFADPSRN